MSPVSHIDVARARRSRRVLFVGNPSRYNEVSQWASVRQWVTVHGMELIRELDGDVLCAIVTDDVLDGACSPRDSATMNKARALGVVCVSHHDTSRIWEITARVRTRGTDAANKLPSRTRHGGA
ncbi:hypothetical protein EEB14_04200 [Rhodococcus sp. WS4]|nr:hypothetical protein EEB14_04200 [Rhodococcus sp. WS4]